MYIIIMINIIYIINPLKTIRIIYILNKNIYINNNFEFILNIDSWVKFVTNVNFTYA